MRMSLRMKRWQPSMSLRRNSVSSSLHVCVAFVYYCYLCSLCAADCYMQLHCAIFLAESTMRASLMAASQVTVTTAAALRDRSPAAPQHSFTQRERCAALLYKGAERALMLFCNRFFSMVAAKSRDKHAIRQEDKWPRVALAVAHWHTMSLCMRQGKNESPSVTDKN
jgi:hypothetical protein